MRSGALGNEQTRDMSAKGEVCEAAEFDRLIESGLREDKIKSQDNLGKLGKMWEKMHRRTVGGRNSDSGLVISLACHMTQSMFLNPGMEWIYEIVTIMFLYLCGSMEVVLW